MSSLEEIARGRYVDSNLTDDEKEIAIKSLIEGYNLDTESVELYMNYIKAFAECDKKPRLQYPDMERKKLFCKWRETLKESLETTIEVNSIEDIEKYINKPYPVYSNVRIKEEEFFDPRYSKEWGCIVYEVLAYCIDEGTCVIGSCNFFEDKP